MNFFKKLFQEHCQCQTDWVQIRPDILSGLIWVQTVCKGYQQIAKVTVSKEEFKWLPVNKCITYEIDGSYTGLDKYRVIQSNTDKIVDIYLPIIFSMSFECSKEQSH